MGTKELECNNNNNINGIWNKKFFVGEKI
jgi:hypothetical protein